MFAKLTSTLLWSLTLIACSSNESTRLSEQNVAAFHQQFNERQFKYIYDHSSTILKQHSTETELIEFLEGVHNKLGKLKHTEQQQWNVTKNIGKPTSITLTYSSTFEHGEAQEQFIFYQEHEKNLLAGYHINSKDLVIR